MTLLNTTFCISPSHEKLFLSWAKEQYLREIESRGHEEAKILRLPVAESDSQCFAIQFCLPDAQAAEQWLTTTLPSLIAHASEKPYSFPAEAILHFSTIMEVIE